MASARSWRPSLQFADLNQLVAQLRRSTGDREGIRDVAEAGLAEASGVIVQSAKENLQRSTSPKARGQLAESIGFVIRRYVGRGFTQSIIGPSWPLGAHGHLFELGTQERPRSYSGDKLNRRDKRKLRKQFIAAMGTTGRMPAKPFLRPAFDENAERARSIIRVNLERFLVRIMAQKIRQRKVA